MIYKSTLESREWYGKFTTSLQEYSVLDSKGHIVNKKDLFDMLYTENGANVPLFLVMEGLHPLYSLEVRQAYNKALVEQQYISELIRTELAKRAVCLLRQHGTPVGFDQVVLMMVEGMLEVLENNKEIETSVKSNL